MRRVALAMWAGTVTVVGGALLLPVLVGAPSGLDGYAEWREVTLVAVADASLGAVIVSRHPRHPVGWLFVAGGVLGALQVIAGQYAGLGPTMVAAAPFGAWIAMQAQFLSVMSIVFVFQVFPTGRVLSPRWRALPYATAVGVGLDVLAMGLAPGPVDIAPRYDNPLGIVGAGPALAAVERVGIALIAVGVAGGLVSLALRLRVSDGMQRQQVKYLFYAATVSVGVLVVANVFFAAAMEQTVLGNLVWGGAAVSLELAMAVALLRYRLYEIDRIISRTVTYAVVTAVLAGVYVLVAVLPATVLRAPSDLLVAAATLAAAAVFVPARRHVQAVVDRHFNRSRYDAVRVVEQFAHRLRRTVDIDSLATDLHGTVAATVQPAHLSLWMPRRDAIGMASFRAASPRILPRNDSHNVSRTPRWSTGGRGG
ncbi:MAG TPA: hypothetical protein VK891_10695 [Euzebyales bacterium]|nr:hypothetical protein [Euzebyales bacterium]